MPVASVVPVVLSSVNARVAVPPAITGSSVNALVKSRPVTRSLSLAGRLFAVTPETVAVTSEVVLVWNPDAAAPGHVQA